MTMNTAQPGKIVSIPAASDISATPYRFVDTSSGQLALSSAGGAVVGVYNGTGGTGAGKAAGVTLDGIEFVEAGGTVTIDDYVKSDSVGRCVTASAADRQAGLARGKCIGATTTIGGRAVIQLNPGPVVIAASGVETLTGAGAASVYYSVTECVATTDAITLADGLYVGQRKLIRLIVGSTGSNTVTPASVSANTDGGTTPASFTLTTIGQWLELEWRSDGWKLIEAGAAGVGAVTDASTINLLHAINHATIAGTDTITVPDGYYVGQRCNVIAIAASATPVMVLSGKFYDEDGSADGITATFDPCAVSDRISFTWTGARWQHTDFVNAAIAP